MAQPKIKIAFVGITLNTGGAERVQAKLSFLFEAQNIEIHHILVNGDVGYSYAGQLFDMSVLKNTSNSPFNRFKRMLTLRKYLKKHKFNYIIDFRDKRNFIQEYAIANCIYNAPSIQYVHSFNTQLYFPKNNFLAKTIFKKGYGIVTVSEAIENKVREEYGYTKVTTIHNPVDILEIEKLAADDISVPEKYILGIGRMKDNVKQFDHLIHAFQISVATSQNIKLVIVGEGEYKTELEKLVLEKNLKEHVVFYPFANNPFPYYKNALFTAMTSKFEGFPNVLIESLATGTPVVSYNCNSGPNEIINHKENGLIVKNQDIDGMALAINSMLLDKTLYEKCRQNAKQSVARFSPNHIITDWLKFLELN
ncbi:glycosyltransferase [Aureisphaera sp. CAU 1614]|uniref:Glycosyltransferase n=1 Tax=Halomarinibacterium sedimenti TaxID=2857106 RepID=A0A9X1FQU8_9FLAO|nr:glycosyltransferase [Halomarinibacterium sedimenti]MBW2938906.1 glycosyltransferase [Halomarinibacterium sedimenti]